MIDGASTSASRHITPDTTIPDLVRSLGDDSKHLLRDELRLAKLEMREAAHHAGAGAIALAVAFAAIVVAAVAATMFVATFVGRLVGGHMWLGSLVAAGIDLGVGVLLVLTGLGEFAEPPRALDELTSASGPLTPRLRRAATAPTR